MTDSHELLQLKEFLLPYPRPVQDLALAGRDQLLAQLGPVTELFYDATSAVCSGFTHTHKPKDSFVNLAVYSDHVTLVFSWGARLRDPESRLRGGGNQVRHLRLAGIETLQDPYVVDLISQASEAAARPRAPLEPKTIVKVYEGVKRRPKASD